MLAPVGIGYRQLQRPAVTKGGETVVKFDLPDDLDMPYPQYRCPVCAKDLPLTEARLAVTCADHQPAERELAFLVREATAEDRRDIEEICDRAWGETDIDAFGRTFDVLAGTNLVAEADGTLAGLVSLALERGELVVVLLSVYPEYQGAGVGSALMSAAVEFAAGRGLPLVRVAVSNDDIPSLYFYQRHGFAIYEVAIGLVADDLGAVVAGFSGIPVRDEIRLRRPVCQKC